MGVTDYVFNSYKPLGENFLPVCQTKSLDSCMGKYWISPAGQLFQIDERDAFRYVETSEEELRDLSPIERLFAIGRYEPTGLHGKIHPVYHLGEVTIYPAQWERDWEDWPEAKLFFKYGVIKDYVTTTFGRTRLWRQ